MMLTRSQRRHARPSASWTRSRSSRRPPRASPVSPARSGWARPRTPRPISSALSRTRSRSWPSYRLRSRSPQADRVMRSGWLVI